MKVDLGFADLYCRLKDVSDIASAAKDAYLKNKRMFCRDIKRKFKITICYSRRELDEQWGGKTEEWLTALSDVGRIAMFNDKLIRKYGSPKIKGGVRSTLEHEINHQFYYQFTGSWKPSWLLEGLATQFGGYRLHADDKRILRGRLPHLLYSHSGKSYWKHAKLLYPMGFLATRYLLRKHGKKRLYRMLEIYAKKKTKAGFEAAFKKTFGYTIRELEKRVFSKH